MLKTLVIGGLCVCVCVQILTPSAAFPVHLADIEQVFHPVIHGLGESTVHLTFLLPTHTNTHIQDRL